MKENTTFLKKQLLKWYLKNTNDKLATRVLEKLIEKMSMKHLKALSDILVILHASEVKKDK